MSKRTVLLILIGIIVIAASLRLFGLDRQSLWYDEVAEENAFQRQFLIKSKTLKPYTPPLNLFFIYPMTRMFPGSDFALRMVPFIFGVISVPLFYLLGKHMFNEKIGLIASFMLAISPFHIWYSQDARMYSLQWMLSLMSLIFFLRMLRQPLWKYYVFYILATTAALYTHQTSVFLLVMQGIYLFIIYWNRKQQLFRFATTLGTNVILYLPWIIYSLTSLVEKPAGFSKQVDWNALLYTIYSYSAGFSIGPSLRELHLNQSISVIKPYLVIIIFLMSVYVILFVSGLYSVRKNRENLLILLLLLTTPIIGVLILNKILPNITYNVRYTGTALFGYLLFIAKGLDHLRNQRPQWMGKTLCILALIAITGFSTYSYTNYQFDNKYAKPDIREAVTYIENRIISDDLVLTVINNPAFDRYSKYDRLYVSFPYYTDPNSKKHVEFQLEKMLSGKKRLWLVLNTEWYQHKLVDYAKGWIDTNFEEIKHLRNDMNGIANVRIYVYNLTRKISQ